MTVVTVKGMGYHLDKHLEKKWDLIKDGKLTKFDEDRFYIVDGTEGAGKSLFAIQQAAYIDETILDDVKGKILPRICFTSQEFLTAIRTSRSTKDKTRVIIFDEAFRGLSSKSALSKDNKMLVQALMEARQNNLVVFIVSPSFYLIEFYAAVLRSQALFHVIKEKKSRMRYVRIFGKKDKAILYQIGVRKGWGYPRWTKERARFYNKYPGGDDFEAKYRKKKRDSLGGSEKEQIMTNRNEVKLCYMLKTLVRLIGSYKNVSEELLKDGFKYSESSVGQQIKRIETTKHIDPAYQVNTRYR